MRSPIPSLPHALAAPLRDEQQMLQRVRQEWGGRSDLWVFAYGSLIWNPEIDVAERRPLHVQGWHRALKMWSRINRGTPECPGLVFALLPGGSCRGIGLRIARRDADEALQRLWAREMLHAVYDPRWLHARDGHGSLRVLAFTLSRRSPSYTGVLDEARYRQIFREACGRYGTTLDYARATHDSLRQHGIHDAALARLLRLTAPGR